MSTQYLLAIILSLSLSGVWLVHKLNGFQRLPKINDTKGIVIPSFVFLSSPFLAIWIMPALTNGDVNEIIKPIIPLITFILGQTITKREKQKETKKQEIALSTMIIHEIEIDVIGSLSRIEGQLMASVQKPEAVAIVDEIKSLCEKFELEMEKLDERLRVQLDVIKIDSAIGIPSYIGKIKRDLKRIASIELTPENRLRRLGYIRLHIVEGYTNIVILSISHEELKNRFLDGFILKLNQERKRLIQLRDHKKSITEHWRGKPENERPKNSDITLYLQFDINTEDKAIQEIESLFQRFEIPIKNVVFGSHISDFEINSTS